MLLRELAVRTPLTKVARLLSAHQFIKSLRKTLGWLQAQVNRVAESSDGGVANEELFEESPDSAKSSSSAQRTSKKRKLDGTETVSQEVLFTTISTFRVLYLAIFDTVRQLLLLTTDPDRIYGYAVEHMKISLSSSPEDAAHVLGSSFYLTNRLIQESQSVSAITGYKNCLLPAIDLWDHRSLTGQHSNTSSNVRNPQNRFCRYYTNVILVRAYSWLLVYSLPFSF